MGRHGQSLGVRLGLVLRAIDEPLGVRPSRGCEPLAVGVVLAVFGVFAAGILLIF